MCRFIRALAILVWVPAFAGMTTAAVGMTTAAKYPGVGRPATPAEIAAWDIDVRPDFKGLPPGSGSVAQGQGIWDGKCASCHGTFGESNEVFTPLTGGVTQDDIKSGRTRSLTSPDVGRTTLMKLSSLSTLWDYIHRAMPWNAPKSLSIDEVYAVLAYLLNLGDILPADFVLSDRNMAEVQARLPNRNGMSREHGLWDVKGRPDVRNPPCMKDCPLESLRTAALPEYARGNHGNLADQNRVIGPVRGQETGGAKTVAVADLARNKGCLGCHAVDKRVVGQAFKEIATRYRGEAGVEAKLAEKLLRGGFGNWGQVPMPPNPELAESDARRLVLWVLGAGN